MQLDTSISEEKRTLLSIGEASEYLGVSIDTLRRWAKKGKIETHRSPGNHRYFYKKNLDDLFGTKYERTEETKSRTKDFSETKENRQESSDQQINKPTTLEPEMQTEKPDGFQNTTSQKEEAIDWTYKYENKIAQVVEVPQNQPIKIISVAEKKEEISHKKQQMPQSFPEIIHYGQYQESWMNTSQTPLPPANIEVPKDIKTLTNESNDKLVNQHSKTQTSILDAPVEAQSETETVNKPLPQPPAKEKVKTKSRSFSLTTNQVIIITVITFVIAVIMLMLVFINPQSEILSPVP